MIPILSFKEPNNSYEAFPEHEVEELKQRVTLSTHCSLSHLLSFIAGCLLILLGGFIYHIFERPEIGQPFSPIPSMPLEIVTFSSHPEYSTPSITAWESLTEDFSGYIHIENPEKFALQPGVPTKEGENVYGVSMYHSLHCLKMIHHDYWTLVQSPLQSGLDSAHDQSHMTEMRAHIGHCFDYIRQSIQCSADMTISWANFTEPERPHIDGWDIPHRQCHDWKSILPILKTMDAMSGSENLNDHHGHHR